MSSSSTQSGKKALEYAFLLRREQIKARKSLVLSSGVVLIACALVLYVIGLLAKSHNDYKDLYGQISELIYVAYTDEVRLGGKGIELTPQTKLIDRKGTKLAPSTQLVDKKETLPKTNCAKLYLEKHLESDKLGFICDSKDIIFQRADAEWTAVMLDRSVIAWVSATLVEDLGSNIGRVVNHGVPYRSQPIMTEFTEMGQLGYSETIQLIKKIGNWYQIYAPADYEVWVPTTSLSILQ